MKEFRVPRGTIIFKHGSILLLLLLPAIAADGLPDIMHYPLIIYCLYLFWVLINPPVMFKLTHNGVLLNGDENLLIPWEHIASVDRFEQISKTFLNFDRIYLSTWEEKPRPKYHFLNPMNYLLRSDDNSCKFNFINDRKNADLAIDSLKNAFNDFSFVKWPMSKRIRKSTPSIAAMINIIENSGDQQLITFALPILYRTQEAINSKSQLPYDELTALFTDNDDIDRLWEEFIDKKDTNASNFINAVIKITDLLGLDPETNEYYKNSRS